MCVWSYRICQEYEWYEEMPLSGNDIYAKDTEVEFGKDMCFYMIAKQNVSTNSSSYITSFLPMTCLFHWYQMKSAASGWMKISTAIERLTRYV